MRDRYLRHYGKVRTDIMIGGGGIYTLARPPTMGLYCRDQPVAYLSIQRHLRLLDL